MSGKATGTKETGVQIVASWGQVYTEPTVSADKILKLQTNPYARKLQLMQERMIFPDRPTFQVFGPDGKPDQELGKRLTAMVEAEPVDLGEKLPMAWSDVFWWGCSILNPIWDWVGNEYRLLQLRRLAPEGFAQAPSMAQAVYSPILQGIVLDQGVVRYYQTQSELALEPMELDARSVTMIKEPSHPGHSLIVPIMGALSMLEFAWNAQMQKVNRIGAPIMFIRVKNATEEDISYAQGVLRKWGKDTAFQLRENMELVKLEMTDSEVALSTIQELSQLIMEYFTPNAKAGKDAGISIGSSSWAEQQLMTAYIKGVHRWICSQFERMLQPWLDNMNYSDGYTIQIDLPEPDMDRADLELRQAQVGFQTKCMTLNEMRTNLGLKEIDEAGKAELVKFYRSSPPTSPKDGLAGRIFTKLKEERR